MISTDDFSLFCMCILLLSVFSCGIFLLADAFVLFCHLYQLNPHLAVNFNLFGGAASFERWIETNTAPNCPKHV
jgi:ABC-type maltose transport system permease subunit